MISTASATQYIAIVVRESERLHELTQETISKRKLHDGRAVRAESKRFARTVAADPSILVVTVHDIVGYCQPRPHRSWEIEPI